jgi:hypothetical protein
MRSLDHLLCFVDCAASVHASDDEGKALPSLLGGEWNVFVVKAEKGASFHPSMS